MVVALISNKSYAQLIMEYERIYDDPIKRLQFLKDNKDRRKWPTIGHAVQAPYLMIGSCYHCDEVVEKFSGWSLKVKISEVTYCGYAANSELFCRRCTPITPGWRLDQITSWDTAKALLGY